MRAGVLRHPPAAQPGNVAAEVGYESEAAFNHALKRELGVSPGRSRRGSASPYETATD